LPPALFLCGTFDPSIGDTIMMSFKWQVAGAKPGEVDSGGPHDFQLFPLERLNTAQIGRKALRNLLKKGYDLDSGFNLSRRKPCISLYIKANMKRARTWSVTN